MVSGHAEPLPVDFAGDAYYSYFLQVLCKGVDEFHDITLGCAVDGIGTSQDHLTASVLWF